LIYRKNKEKFPVNIQNTDLLFGMPLAICLEIIREIGFHSRNSWLNTQIVEVLGGYKKSIRELLINTFGCQFPLSLPMGKNRPAGYEYL